MYYFCLFWVSLFRFGFFFSAESCGIPWVSWIIGLFFSKWGRCWKWRTVAIGLYVAGEAVYIRADYIVFKGAITAFHLHLIQKCYTNYKCYKVASSFNCSKGICCLSYLANKQTKSIFTESWRLPNSAGFTLTLLCRWGVGLQREHNFCLLWVLSWTVKMNFSSQTLFV